MGSLSQLRVLDLSRVLAGPWASQLLGDLGAEVIKVERPEGGDETRRWGPPLRDEHGRETEESAYYRCTNRNKKSAAIDMAQPEGQELVRRLAAKSDVVIENFMVGALGRYGLDYASLSRDHPELIYCSITGFGQDGPYAARAGYDLLIQGLGGMMSLTGRPDGEPGAGPLKVGVALTDILTGLYATVGILAALSHRASTGEGQYIDAALLDVQVACLANQASDYLVSGVAPTRSGNAHPNIVPYGEFPTRDAHMILAIGNDAQFAHFCTAVGRSEWARDNRFATNPARVANRKPLLAMMRDLTSTRSTAEWTALLEPLGVPCGPINDLAAVFADPQVRHRGMEIHLPNARGGDVALVASPLRLSVTPVEYRSAPPGLGANTREVLTGLLGLSPERVAELERHRVIRT